MRLKVIKAYGSFSVGAIIPDAPGNVARTLIGRGLVEEDKVMVSPARRPKGMVGRAVDAAGDLLTKTPAASD